MISKKNLIPYFDKMIPGPMPEPVAAPAPTPAPAPAGPQPGDWGGAPAVQRYTKKGEPVDQYGNKMNTDAGRAKSAQMVAAAQKDVAIKAYEVAQSEAVHGRVDEANKALQAANTAANQYVAGQNQVKEEMKQAGKTPKYENVKNFQESAAETSKRIQGIIESQTPKPGPKPEEPGPKEEEKKETVIQPSNIRPTPTFRTPDPPKPKVVKNPNRDVVNFSREQFSQSSIARLLFEQVGSIELVNIARRETIEGQNPYYTLISNLSTIRKNFDPTSLISRQKSNRNIEDNYSIDLNSKIPDDEYLDRNNLSDFYYIDDNGDLVIELDNLAPDEIIDFEIAESGTINLVDEA